MLINRLTQVVHRGALGRAGGRFCAAVLCELLCQVHLALAGGGSKGAIGGLDLLVRLAKARMAPESVMLRHCLLKHDYYTQNVMIRRFVRGRKGCSERASTGAVLIRT